jgi:hypothetical protein
VKSGSQIERTWPPDSDIEFDNPRLRRAIGRFLRRFSERFAAADFVESIGWDVFSRPDEGKVVIRCPLERLHSNFGEVDEDPGCVAVNADASDGGHAFLKCQHQHGASHRTSDLLAKIIEQLNLDGNPLDIAADFVAEDRVPQ